MTESGVLLACVVWNNAAAPILHDKEVTLAMAACRAAARVSLSLEVAATVVKRQASLFHPKGEKAHEKGRQLQVQYVRHNLCVSIYVSPSSFLYLFISSRKLQIRYRAGSRTTQLLRRPSCSMLYW